MNPFDGLAGPLPMLIIAPEPFISALQPLVQHKNLTGMPTAALSISSSTPHFQGSDDPETIKNAIRYAHENLSTKYVMLVGDAHWFPVRFYFLHYLVTRFDPDEWTQAGVPPTSPLGDWFASDLYYANLYHHTGNYPNLLPGAFDNWDSNANGLYNEMNWVKHPYINPDNVDGYPDVAVGRVPAHSPADVTAYVNKVITYESPLRGLARGLTFTFVHDQHYGHPELSTELKTQTGLMDRGSVTAKFLLIGNAGSNPPQGWANADAADVVSAAKESDWVSYIGHGDTHDWGGVVGDADVAQTANSNALPVVFAIGCSTGQFIPDLPWNSDYLDSGGNTAAHQGNHGPFSMFPGAQPKANGPVILDGATGRRWGVNCTPPGCDPLPAQLPTPDPYDYDRQDLCFAYPWLITGAPGGAIAYFGEVGIAPDSNELEKYLLGVYATEVNPILGDIYLMAQQEYWPKHKDENPHFGSRCYLGWVVFFGDPSLRLPRLRDPRSLRQFLFVGGFVPSQGIRHIQPPVKSVRSFMNI